MALISEQHNQDKKTDRYLIQGESNGKTVIRECCLVHPQGSPGTRQTLPYTIILEVSMEWKLGKRMTGRPTLTWINDIQ